MAITKLLFAVDDSEYSRKAIKLVGMLGPGCRDLEVIIMHVIDSIPSLIGSPMREQLKAEMVAAGEKVTDSFKVELEKLGIRCTTRIEQGDVAAQVLRVVEQEGCELIAMGARGQSSVEEILLGSVSQKVLQHARIPVLIAR